eukprot:6465345-Lingulodinium_polyedra.AAC.1
MDKLRQYLGLDPVLPSNLFKLVQSCIEHVLPKASTSQVADFMSERAKLHESVDLLAGAGEYVEDLLSKDDHKDAQDKWM